MNSRSFYDLEEVVTASLVNCIVAEVDDPKNTRDLIDGLLSSDPTRTVEILSILVRELAVLSIHSGRTQGSSVNSGLQKVEQKIAQFRNQADSSRQASKLGTVSLPKVSDYGSNLPLDSDSASDIPSHSSDSSGSSGDEEVDDAEELWRLTLPVRQSISTTDAMDGKAPLHSNHSQSTVTTKQTYQTHRDFFESLVNDVELAQQASPEKAGTYATASGMRNRRKIDSSSPIITTSLEEKIHIAIRSATENRLQSLSADDIDESGCDDGTGSNNNGRGKLRFTADLLNEICRAVVHYVGLDHTLADACEAQLTVMMQIFLNSVIDAENFMLLAQIIKSTIERQLHSMNSSVGDGAAVSEGVKKGSVDKSAQQHRHHQQQLQRGSRGIPEVELEGSEAAEENEGEEEQQQEHEMYERYLQHQPQLDNDAYGRYDFEDEEEDDMEGDDDDNSASTGTSGSGGCGSASDTEDDDDARPAAPAVGGGGDTPTRPIRQQAVADINQITVHQERSPSNARELKRFDAAYELAPSDEELGDSSTVDMKQMLATAAATANAAVGIAEGKLNLQHPVTAQDSKSGAKHHHQQQQHHHPPGAKGTPTAKQIKHFNDSSTDGEEMIDRSNTPSPAPAKQHHHNTSGHSLLSDDSLDYKHTTESKPAAAAAPVTPATVSKRVARTAAQQDRTPNYNQTTDEVPAWEIPKSPMESYFRRGYGGLGQEDLQDAIAASAKKKPRAHEEGAAAAADADAPWNLPKSPLDAEFRRAYGGLGHGIMEDAMLASAKKRLQREDESDDDDDDGESQQQEDEEDGPDSEAETSSSTSEASMHERVLSSDQLDQFVLQQREDLADSGIITLEVLPEDFGALTLLEQDAEEAAMLSARAAKYMVHGGTAGGDECSEVDAEDEILGSDPDSRSTTTSEWEGAAGDAEAERDSGEGLLDYSTSSSHGHNKLHSRSAVAALPAAAGAGRGERKASSHSQAQQKVVVIPTQHEKANNQKAASVAKTTAKLRHAGKSSSKAAGNSKKPSTPSSSTSATGGAKAPSSTRTAVTSASSAAGARAGAAAAAAAEHRMKPFPQTHHDVSVAAIGLMDEIEATMDSIYARKRKFTKEELHSLTSSNGGGGWKDGGAEDDDNDIHPDRHPVAVDSSGGGHSYGGHGNGSGGRSSTAGGGGGVAHSDWPLTGSRSLNEMMKASYQQTISQYLREARQHQQGKSPSAAAAASDNKGSRKAAEARKGGARQEYSDSLEDDDDGEEEALDTEDLLFADYQALLQRGNDLINSRGGRGGSGSGSGSGVKAGSGRKSPSARKKDEQQPLRRSVDVRSSSERLYATKTGNVRPASASLPRTKKGAAPPAPVRSETPQPAQRRKSSSSGFSSSANAAAATAAGGITTSTSRSLEEMEAIRKRLSETKAMVKSYTKTIDTSLERKGHKHAVAAGSKGASAGASKKSKDYRVKSPAPGAAGTGTAGKTNGKSSSRPSSAPASGRSGGQQQHHPRVDVPTYSALMRSIEFNRNK